MKVHRESKGIAPLILNFGARQAWAVNNMLRPRKKPGTYWTEGCVCPWTGTDDFEKRTSLTAAIRTLDGPARSLVSTPTMQSQQLSVRKKYYLELRHNGTQNDYKAVLFYERVNEIRVVTGSESSRRSEVEHINVISIRNSVFETHIHTHKT
jgi:hypothetical protein